MAFSFLKEDNLSQKFSSAKIYTESLNEPFPEFDRIARNVPHKGKDPRYPNTTDGTTAATIRKLGKRIVQQLPTGKVEADDDDHNWLPVVADFIYRNKILPFANLEYDLIQKCWQVIERGATFGSTAVYTPFVNHDGYFCPDMVLPYWGDVFIQPGKKSGYDCDFVFIRSWWQADDIDNLIEGEKKRAKDAKDRGEKYDSTWDTKALQLAKEMTQTKDTKALTPHEQDRSTKAEGIPVITGFQKGEGATFYTFLIGGTEDEVTIIRRKTNKDPRGKIPVDFYYHDTDGANPLGRGIVELIGGLQNLIDSDMQMYQFNRALMLAPPVIKRGTFSKKKIVYAPNAIIDVGTDPAADVKPLDVDTSAVVNYPALYGLQKSQLLNLVNSPDTSISSDIGNPGFGKTPQAISAQQAVISVDDNFVRKMFEAWFEHWSETAINLYFAERSGTEIIQLDSDTAKRLRELPTFDQSLLSPNNEIMIDFDTATPALKFRVDPSTTQVKDNAAQVQDATNLLDIVMKYPMLDAAYGGPIDHDVLARRIVINSGIEDPEQVAPEPTEEQKQAKEQAKHQPNPFSPMFDKPSIRVNFPDLPPAAQVQVLGMAGIQVTTDDIMAGPVADPNLRGVMNPLDGSGVTLPGGAQAGANVNPIDIGDIYKATTDPTVKAQIEKMAGLTPSDVHVGTHLVGNATKAVPQQPQPMQPQASTDSQDQSTQPEQPDQTPTDQPATDQLEPGETQPDPNDPNEAMEQALTQKLQEMGVPDNLIAEAHQMAESGQYTADQIMQAILGVMSNG